MRNHLENSKPRPSSLRLEILMYLRQNPQACDTLVGIARWWVPKQRIEAITREVKEALEDLIKQGLVVQTKRAHGQPLYSLNQERPKVRFVCRSPSSNNNQTS